MKDHPLKMSVITLIFAAVFTCAAIIPGYAFTETKVPPAAQPAPDSGASKLQLKKSQDSTGLSLSDPGAASSGGTELTIPGVGAIGKLPNLDFGLELLYGSGTGQGPETSDEEQSDDVLIKGKIRHRF